MIVCCAAGRVGAQSAAQAEALFRQGKEQMAAGKYAEACAAFEASQKAEAATSTLLNLANCREKNGELDPVQEGFHEKHALQCGFCTPGMIMTIRAFLNENPHPSEREVRLGLEGNLCRCTGYHNIVKAVLACAEGAPS